MKKIKLNRYFLLLLFLLLLSGCGKKTVTKTTYDDLSNHHEINHIVVLSIGNKNKAESIRFENKLANAINQNGLKATSFQANRTHGDDISEKSVKSLVDEIGADAVLVTKLVSIEYDSKIKPGRPEVIKTPLNHGLKAVFQEYEVINIYNPEQVKIKADVKINARLFSAKTENIVWSADTATFKRDDSDNVINDFIKSITHELMKKLR
ncbi:hypothetical protein [Marinicella gelatinilytica]|uniref:hypothetical protein n=1 Tax=Marinicella gelatinilytica TaxID=2996017 RepID=UPI002260DA1A|nr:hypothetical protein [Marinicella gelatinilytica]MCX7545187.1 hypothetical protein [Marinicella gelatinilytica]